MLDDAALTTAIPAGTAVSGDEAGALLEGVAETPVTEPEAAPAQPPVDLSAQIAALQQQVQELTARASAPAGPTVDHNQLVSAMVAAEHARQAEHARIQAQRADLQPPTFTEDEKAALVADPDAQLKAMQRIAMHGAKTVLAQVSDDLWKARAAFEWSATHNDAVADWAFNKGRELAVNAGMKPEEFDALGDGAYNLLWQSAQQSPNPHMHFLRMTQTPQAIYAATTMARAQQAGGPPITDKRPVAPTVGAGTHRETQTPQQPRVPNATLARAEAALGRKLTPADAKKLREIASGYQSAFPSAV